MTDFEWRRSLRDLCADTEPPAHVWGGILARIGGAERLPSAPPRAAARRSRRRFAWRVMATAASVLVVFAIARMAPTTRPEPAAAVRAASVEPKRDRDPAATSESILREGLARNPVLAATDAELREIQEQLQRALVLEPGSERLRRMLMRTEGERRRLLQYQSQLG